MVPGILGKKIGMTQIFKEDGGRVPVTVIEAGPCSVQAIKTEEKNGYNSVQVGYEDTKEQRVKKPQREYLKANSLQPKKFVREIRCDGAPDVKVGDTLTNTMFQKGDFLDIIGISKGKGFQGAVKRHGFSGSNVSHGGSSMRRRPGSIGQSSYPSRVFKGMKMPGHMGSDTTTVQNIEVVDVDFENNTIAVLGSIPGANGTYVVIKYAKKKALAERTYVEEEPEEEQQAEEAQEEQAPQEETQEDQPQEEQQEAKPEEEKAEDKEQGKEGNEEQK
jgi:large subunit ribosomal protein L3